MTAWIPVLLGASAAAVITAAPQPGALRLASMQAGSRRPVLSSPAVVLIPLTALLVVSLPLAVLVGIALALVRRSQARQRRESDAVRERSRALDALSLLAAELRVGRPPADAFAAAAEVAAGPARNAFAAAGSAARLGGDVAAAMSVVGSAIPDVLRALGACWQVCSEAGSGLAAAVERLEEGLRAAEAQRRAIAAELAGPRATAQLLAVLPLLGVGLASALGAHPVRLLLHTALGLVCLTAGLLLDVLGVLWTRRLVATAVP
jgi:tight adherence protein B